MRERPTAIIAMLLFLPLLGLSARETSFEQRLSPADLDAFIAPLFERAAPPQARYAVDVYELFVDTEHPSGARTPVRVQLFVPVTEPDAPRGSYLFAPGSTGLINPCRVSREHVADIRWGLYRAHVLSLAGQGYIGILPDYMGFEDWDLIQPYFHAESEARLIADVTAAVDGFLAERVPGGLRSMTRVAAGYSQGGHAVFAAADRNNEFPDGLELDGLIGYGPTTAVDALFLEYPSVAPMVVQAYRTIYGDEAFDPLRVLAEPWASKLAYDTTRQCVGAMQSHYPDRATDLFRVDFMKSLWAGTLAITHPELCRIMEDNRAGLTGHGVPVLILQGTDDIVVDRRTQDRFVITLREAGSDVRYLVYEGARHDTRQISWPAVVEWIDALP
ncbi:MAG: serine aminopeptidase domain-containing protein [Spirochaetota bacterium]